MHDDLRKCAPLIAVALLFGCKTDGPVEYGWLRIQTVTSGSDIDDSYEVAINTPTGPRTLPPLGPNDSAVLETSAGEVHVTLGQIDPNCLLSGANPRIVQVPANDTAAASFAVTCVAIGAYISINIGFAGVDRDVDGYRVALDNVEHPVRVIDSITFRKVPPGTHALILRGVAANCSTASDTLQQPTFAVGDTLRVRWDVTCTEVTSRRLLFSGYYEPTLTGWDVFVRYPHDTFPTNLTHASGNNWQPVWSPDGQRIAFVSDRSGRDEIFAMNADGSGVVQLTNATGGNFYPAWSPDGSRIAFISGRGGRNTLYVMNADGSSQTRFTTDTAVENFAIWAPDGVRIAYVRGCTECIPATSELYVADGTDTVRLTTQAHANYWPAWSPDGAHIAIFSRDSLTIMDADGSHIVRVAGGALGPSPAWSPDSKQVAFGYRGAVHRVRFDGSGDTLLAVGGDPAWSPDGTAIVFVTPIVPPPPGNCLFYMCFLELTVMNSDGTRQVRLTARSVVARPQWAP
jgi:TolB protein